MSQDGKPFKKIRTDLYDYLKKEGFNLTDERHKTIREFVKNHHDLHSKNMESQIKVLGPQAEKLGLLKARIKESIEKGQAAIKAKDPKSPAYEMEIIVLKKMYKFITF